MSSNLQIPVDLDPGQWTVVNDVVMGGVSSARIEPAEQGVRFSGTLSLENNGGFASARFDLATPPAGMDGVQIRVRGDGRTYQLRLRHGQARDGVAWRVKFKAPGDWTVLALPFTSFQPVFRGRSVPEAGPVMPASLGQAGLMLADRTAGDFSLELARLAFYRDAG